MDDPKSQGQEKEQELGAETWRKNLAQELESSHLQEDTHKPKQAWTTYVAHATGNQQQLSENKFGNLRRV